MLFSKEFIIDKQQRRRQILRTILFFFVAAILLGFTMLSTSSFVERVNEGNSQVIQALNDTIEEKLLEIVHLKDSINDMKAQRTSIEQIPEIIEAIFTKYKALLDHAKIEDMGTFNTERLAFNEDFLNEYRNTLENYPTMKTRLEQTFQANFENYNKFRNQYVQLENSKIPESKGTGSDCSEAEKQRDNLQGRLKELGEYLQKIEDNGSCYGRVKNALVIIEKGEKNSN